MQAALRIRRLHATKSFSFAIRPLLNLFFLLLHSEWIKSMYSRYSKLSNSSYLSKKVQTNSAGPDQTASEEAV